MLGPALFAAVLLGLAAGVVRSFELGSLLVAAPFALFAMLAGRRSVMRFCGLFMLALLIGALRPTIWPAPSIDGLAPFLGDTVRLTGQVDGPPERHGQVVTFRLRTIDLSLTGRSASAGFEESQPVEGLVEVVALAAGPASRLQVGEWVRAEGRLQAPSSPAGYPRAELLRRRGIFSTLTFPQIELLGANGFAGPFALTSFTTGVERGFERYLPQPQAALASGMLFGGSGGLDPAFRQAFQTAGLGHLTAVSGYNIVIVAFALQFLLGRAVGIRAATVPILVGIAVYTLAVGAPPSAVRAALMAGLVILARVVGRLPDPLTSVLAAGAMMGLLDPQVILDLGFLLSFSATLGLILLYPRLRALFSWLPGWIADALGLTLAAELATLPIVLAVFHHLSVIAPLANLLAAPLVPIIMAAGCLLAASLPIPAMATVVSWMAWLPTTLLAQEVRLLTSLPFASVYTGQFPVLGAGLFAAALAAAGLLGLPDAQPVRDWVARLLGSATLSARAIAAAALTSIVVSISLILGRPDGALHASVLASGKGQAVFLRGPTGATVLVSGGATDPRGLASLVAERLNLWEHGLSAVVVMQPDDQFALAETLRRYPARVVVTAEQDARLDMGGGATLDVFAAGSSDAAATASFGNVLVQLHGSPQISGDDVEGEGSILVTLDGSQVPSPVRPALLAVGGAALLQPDSVVIPAPQEGTVEIATDGVGLWLVSPTAPDAQPTVP